jgi:hypothetical protein
MTIVTVPVFVVVTVLPFVSCTATTGWAVNAAPPAAPLGWVVNPSLVGVPNTVTVGLLAKAVSPFVPSRDWAVKEYVPAVDGAVMWVGLVPAP